MGARQPDRTDGRTGTTDAARFTARTYALLSLATLGVGIVGYRSLAPDIDVLAIQFGGRDQTLPLPGGTARAIAWDWGFIVAYVLTLWWAARLAQVVFRAGSRVRWTLLGLAGVAAAADVVENTLLLRVVDRSADESAARPLLDSVSTAATVKFVCLVVAALIWGTALARTPWRRQATPR